MKRIFFYSVLVLVFLLVDSCSEEQIRIYEITTTSSPEQGGSVTPEKGSYQSGEDIMVTATPADGYEFKNWGGDLTGTIRTAIIRINSDMSIIAIFEMLDADHDGVSDALDQCPNFTNCNPN